MRHWYHLSVDHPPNLDVNLPAQDQMGSRAFCDVSSLHANLSLQWSTEHRYCFCEVSRATKNIKLPTQAHPSIPRTCHHLTPPTISLALSSPPRTWTRIVAASLQIERGTSTLTRWVYGDEGVRVFENSGETSMKKFSNWNMLLTL